MPRYSTSYSPFGDISDLFPGSRQGSNPLKPATAQDPGMGSPQMPGLGPGPAPPSPASAPAPDLGQVPAVPPGMAPQQPGAPIDREALVNLLAQRLHPMRGF